MRPNGSLRFVDWGIEGQRGEGTCFKVTELVAKLDSDGWVLALNQSGKYRFQRVQCEERVTL